MCVVRVCARRGAETMAAARDGAGRRAELVWDPHVYAVSKHAQDVYIQGMMARVEARLTGDEAVLDVGCGDGVRGEGWG